MRVAIVRENKVETMIVAPDGMSTEDYGLWAHAMLSGPFVGAEIQALRDDERCAIGDDRVDGAFVTPPTPIEERLAQIDEQTAGRIAQGFEYKGSRISLSVESQITISNAYTIRDSLPYPLSWSTLDDSAAITITSAADMVAMYQAATTAVLLARTAGNAAKAAARATP